VSNLSSLMEEYKRSRNEAWPEEKLSGLLSEISARMQGRNVLLYFSAFFQKPGVSFTQMMPEDINGIMNAFHNMDASKGLVLILHTPGGDITAAEQIINYVHSIFDDVTAIVPVRCMSAGTMLALSCDEIIISKAGQLGPTDPQIFGPNSVKNIIEQFEMARQDILRNPQLAHLWAPILRTYGHSLYRHATKVEAYAKAKITEWLKQKGKSSPEVDLILRTFHDTPNFHGERIGYRDMKNLGMNVKLLEDDPILQNAVMQAYHVATIYSETTLAVKMIIGNIWEDSNNGWEKVIPQQLLIKKAASA